jgi:hypothetical protein
MHLGERATGQGGHVDNLQSNHSLSQ